MNEPEQEAQEQESLRRNIRHTVAISVLRRIGAIVAEERQADADNAAILRWTLRYGWIVLLFLMIFFAYLAGVI